MINITNIGNFRLREKNGVKFYTIPSFDETRIVKHMFTTRIKGVSKEPYDSLNLGINKEDDIEDVKENFNIISEILDVDINSFVLSNQIHETNIKVIDELDDTRDIESFSDSEGVDGLITNKRGITLCTFYADCVPLYFLDPKKEVIGLAHAGWRGTVDKIGERMLDKMEEVYDCHLDDILVGIGPSIGSCCYEIGENVYEKFNSNFTKPESFLIPTDKDKWHLNLWQANVVILNGKGIPLENITVSELCTSCNNDIFYSYRKECGKTGRMAAIIQMK